MLRAATSCDESYKYTSEKITLGDCVPVHL